MGKPGGSRELRAVALGLLVTLLIEALLFSRAFGNFFNHDSLFYLSRRIESPGQFVQALLEPDDIKQYRPLPKLFFSLFYPFFGLDPYPYHFVPLIMHMANTLLLFYFLLLISGNPFLSVAAAFFFGLHPSNFYVTYDMGYSPDFLFFFFSLAAAIFFVKYRSTRSRLKLALALLSFVMALLSKEVAVTLPFNLFLLALFLDWHEGMPGAGLNRRKVLQALFSILPFLLILALYLALLPRLVLQERLYPQSGGHPYRLTLDPSALTAKAIYLKWALSLPEGLDFFSRTGRLKVLITAFIYGYLVWFVFLSIKFKPGEFKRFALLGFGWFLIALGPLLFLKGRVAHWYLYLPLVGVSLLFGRYAQELRSRALRPALYGLFSVFLVASALGVRDKVKSSDPVYASKVVENCLTRLREKRERLPRGAILYVLKTSERAVSDFFDDGRLYRTFFNDNSIRMYFEDQGHTLPPDYLVNEKVLILSFFMGDLEDVTEEFKADRLDRTGLRLLPLLPRASVEFDRNEPYPSYERFATPDGQPVFLSPARDLMVTIAGASVAFDLPALSPGSQLLFKVRLLAEMGDGAEGSIYFESSDGKRHLLFKRYFQPNDSDWLRTTIDLAPFAGQRGKLLFSCSNINEPRSTIADWLAWGILKIRSQKQELEARS